MGLGSLFEGLGKRLGLVTEKASEFGMSALGSFARGGRSVLGGGLSSLWGTTADVARTISRTEGPFGHILESSVSSRQFVPGVLREMLPSFRRGTIGALPKFGLAAGLDAYMDSPEGSANTPGFKFGAQAVSFGLRFGAYRSLARGVAGTVLGGAGRMVGRPGQFFQQYDYIAKNLGPMWKSGSLTNKALKGAALGARELAYTPIRAVTGAFDMAVGGAKVAGRLAESGLAPFGIRWASKTGGASIAGALTPKAGLVNKFLNRMLPGFLNKELDAPIMSAAIALGGAAQYGLSKFDYNRRNANWQGGPKYNPANYGGGISAMRRGGAQNYGPSLTLMLHSQHSRVMP